jgi:hypothetical protein
MLLSRTYEDEIDYEVTELIDLNLRFNQFKNDWSN